MGIGRWGWGGGGERPPPPKVTQPYVTAQTPPPPNKKNNPSTHRFLGTFASCCMYIVKISVKLHHFHHFNNFMPHTPLAGYTATRPSLVGCDLSSPLPVYLAAIYTPPPMSTTVLRLLSTILHLYASHITIYLFFIEAQKNKLCMWLCEFVYVVNKFIEPRLFYL